MVVCTTLIYTLSSMPLTVWWSAPHTRCPSPYGGLHQTLSPMPLTIWWSAPHTRCPSPYGGLHQTLYAPHHMVVCTKHSMPLTIWWSAPNTLTYAPHHMVVCTKHSMPLTIWWSAQCSPEQHDSSWSERESGSLFVSHSTTCLVSRVLLQHTE